MPNIGRPSRACHACRQKRSKCDLKRPGCGQCLRKHIPCPGYRDESRYRFKIESSSSFPYSRNRDHRRRESNSDPLEFQKSSKVFRERAHPGSEKDKLLALLSKPPPIQNPLAESWDVHFFPIFMQNFYPIHRPLRSLYDVVPRLFAKADPSSALYNACNAMAWMFTTSTTRSPKASVNEAKAYGNAIIALKSTMETPQKCKSDSTFLAIWFLTLFEALRDEKNSINSIPARTGWRFHTQIITNLIHWRGPSQFSTQDGRDLFLLLFGTMETRAYMAGREWKDAITWILYFFKYCDPSEYQRVRACIFAHHCSRICGRIQVLLDANDHNAILHDLPSILEEVSGVEKESYPLSHKKAITDYIVKPPDIPYDLLDDLARSNDLFSQILQSSSRMKLSYHVLELLSRASTGASYATQQIIKPLQSRYIKEITAVADRLLSYLTPNSSSSFSTQIGGITDPSYQGRPEQDGPSRTVTFYSDLENDFNGKSTLSFNYRERGVEVIRFNFEDQKE